MPAIYVFEDAAYDHLYPLTFSRPAFLLRCGHQTLFDRARAALGPIAGALVHAGLADTVHRRLGLPVNPGVVTKNGVILVNGRWLMLDGFQMPEVDTVGLVDYAVAWVHLSAERAAEVDFARITEARALEVVLPRLKHVSVQAKMIARPWDLLAHQRAALEADFKALGSARESTHMAGAHLLEPGRIHLAPDCRIYPGAVLDATHGPIILGRGTTVGPNAVVTGPVAFGEHCVVKAQADIREDSSFGPHARVGGEVNGCIFLGYANKQHHGFLGHTVVGEWANLGAGTTTSNLKNTYGHVRMPINGDDVDSGRQFLGSVIADHAKLGIGTYLSTGSVVGFASHVLVPRPPKFVPSFAWVTDRGIVRADFEKMEQLAATVMARRGIDWTPADHDLFVRIAGDYMQREHYAWSDGG